MAMEKHIICIVEDKPELREAMNMMIQLTDQYVLGGSFSNAEQAIEEIPSIQPDAVLMDINLPDKNGIDLCKEVKEKYPSVFVIGLSTYNQQSFIQKIMDNGASGYVLKNATGQELMKAIETVVKGKIYFSEEASHTLQNKQAANVILTRRETEVLKLIAEGLTNNIIAQKLFISPTTVDTHRKNLLAKLEAKNTASLIRMATQLQLI